MAKSKDIYVKSKGLLIDITKCIGCRGCQGACKQWNQLDAQIKEFNGSYQTQTLDTTTYTVVEFYERETGSGVDWKFAKKQCLHCVDAACVRVCPTDAIDHTPHGTVLRNMDKCIGCGYCVNNCPFKVPQLYDRPDGKLKATQCPLCYDRIREGIETACAKTCPTGALQFGDEDEVLAVAEDRLGEAKTNYPNAQIYRPSGVGGTGVLYLLPDEPTKYGLPSRPQVPASLSFWKNVVQPVGAVALTAAIAGSAISFLFHCFDKRVEDVAAERSETHGS